MVFCQKSLELFNLSIKFNIRSTILRFVHGRSRWDLCAPNSDSKMQILVNVIFTNSFGKVAHINPICSSSQSP